jgi:phage gpG-like protein
MIVMTLVGDDKTVARFRAMSQTMRQSLVDVMRKVWYDLQGYVVTSKLSGQVLRRVTGNLASSIHEGGPNSTTAFTDEGFQLVGKVGTRVKYAAIHEYGFSGEISRTVTQAWGRPVKNPHKITYHATFPERSFLRSGLEDMSTRIKNDIAAAVKDTVRMI